MMTCTKAYSDIPFAHRQHLHNGHCALIHGHNWTFEFTFGCTALDENGFVIDFGKLKWLKGWIDETFDHALVLNASDPWLEYLRQVLTTTRKPWSEAPPFAKLTVVPNCGAEGLIEFLNEFVETALESWTEGRVFITSIRVAEDSKNSAQKFFRVPSSRSCSHV